MTQSREYQGNSIFRNQPPHTFYDKSFGGSTDALYCCLNEIDPLFLEEGCVQNEDAFKCTLLVDPRTKHAVVETFIDHTVEKAPQIFNYSRPSQLTKEEHITYLQVLQAMRDKKDITRRQMVVLKMARKRCHQERARYMEFLKEYCQTNHERIYAPALKLVDLYKRWYRRLSNIIMQKQEDYIFQVHTGFPHPRCCGSSNILGEMTNVRPVRRSGVVSILNSEWNLRELRPRIEAFFEVYCNAIGKQEHIDSANIDGEQSLPQFIIPSESLLFLMCAGDYIDLPTEVLFTVNTLEDKGEREKNLIEFQEPLPSRVCGMHTNLFVVESAFQSFLSFSDRVTWLHVDEQSGKKMESQECKEIEASIREGSTYCIEEHDEYMENLPLNIYQTANRLKSNAVHVSWTLSVNSGERELDILTKTTLPPVQNANGNTFIGSHSIKIEYKSHFGCELATKVELLRDWLRLKLCKTGESLKRHRIDVTTFSTQLDEELTLDDIEEELIKYYNVRMSRLLGGIGDFLELLAKVPAGKYMLRFNPKFKDKLMLCAPVREVTRTCISLHTMLREEISDLPFMTSRVFLPISKSLCNVMHIHYQVRPCAFVPTNKKKQRKGVQGLINDRQYILAKIRKKAELMQAKKRKHDTMRKHRKRTNRTAKRKKKSAAADKQKDELEELRLEIEADKMFYGFDEEANK